MEKKFLYYENITISFQSPASSLQPPLQPLIFITFLAAL
jgi:hypothetical protein